MNLTAKRLRKVLDYNPETGKFVRRIARSNQRAGTETGCINTPGLKGAIYRENRGHWYATTVVRGKKLYLGSFPTAKAAHAAYMKATRQYFGEFANAGMP